VQTFRAATNGTLLGGLLITNATHLQQCDFIIIDCLKQIYQLLGHEGCALAFVIRIL
jgi:hypothetical protein